jgi:hypothetical protein
MSGNTSFIQSTTLGNAASNEHKGENVQAFATFNAECACKCDYAKLTILDLATRHEPGTRTGVKARNI